MAVLIIKLVPKYVMERVSVEGESMKETLQDGDQLIGEKLSVRFNSLKRYDIIYFAPKGNHKSVDFIKRIIGMPGEMIYIVDSVVYINGRPLQEDFAAEDQFLSYTAANPIYLGEDEYFVMGDNRNHSTDSRSSSVGIVHGKDIEGRAVFRLWPLSGFGRID
ncbi:MAG: signal peptidase I [Lachnospiraceae bacterium]|nr:signal peptidase I [Lachnospiraceae bacterium]